MKPLITIMVFVALAGGGYALRLVTMEPPQHTMAGCGFSPQPPGCDLPHNSVPEPGTLALLPVALAAAWIARRRGK